MLISLHWRRRKKTPSTSDFFAIFNDNVNKLKLISIFKNIFLQQIILCVDFDHSPNGLMVTASKAHQRCVADHLKAVASTVQYSVCVGWFSLPEMVKSDSIKILGTTKSFTNRL